MSLVALSTVVGRRSLRLSCRQQHGRLRIEGVREHERIASFTSVVFCRKKPACGVLDGELEGVLW